MAAFVTARSWCRFGPEAFVEHDLFGQRAQLQPVECVAQRGVLGLDPLNFRKGQAAQVDVGFGDDVGGAPGIQGQSDIAQNCP